ncbi:BSD domain-containing protein 1-like isoform X2 [Heterodontus francisci]|uniref:BSD domain-containing protein 1-like isoform X2 n=1 Tax=Heterodontus francisci TaxID=7792 RepID=UPI00355B76B3
MADRWWEGWIQHNIATAKAKSAKAVEFLTRDLAEFTQIIQHDTVTTLAATALAFKEKLNVEEHTEGGQAFSKGLSSLLGAISDAFAPTVEESVPSYVKTVKDIQIRISEPYDGAKVRLCNLEADPATYCSKPDEQYNFWLLSFSLEDEKCAISDLLVNNPLIRDLYTKLVPSEVNHVDFWCRYFYRVYQFHQEEARRTALKERAEQSTCSEDLKWEEDEDEWEGTSAACSPSDLNIVTNDRHSRTLEQPGKKVEETSLRDIATSLSESISNEIQPLALLTIEDNKGIQCKPPTGEAIQMLEAFLEIERRCENKRIVEDDLFYKQFADEDRSIGTDTPDSQEYHISTLQLRNHDGIHLQSDTVQNAVVKLAINVKEADSSMGKEENCVENSDEDLDLDMTEEEIQMTLSRAEALGELESEEWDDWLVS